MSDDRDPYAVECGKRLKLARTAAGFPSRRRFTRAIFEIADMTDLRRLEDRIRTYELGTVMVPAALVNRLRRPYGITPDYIFSDDLASTPPDMRARIVEMEAAEGEDAA